MTAICAEFKLHLPRYALLAALDSTRTAPGHWSPGRWDTAQDERYWEINELCFFNLTAIGCILSSYWFSVVTLHNLPLRNFFLKKMLNRRIMREDVSKKSAVKSPYRAPLHRFNSGLGLCGVFPIGRAEITFSQKLTASFSLTKMGNISLTVRSIKMSDWEWKHFSVEWQLLRVLMTSLDKEEEKNIRLNG
ncbi:hypothetical protein TNIN_68991 [Trichonephila inaurata madagascariensis]|uniref:Uncharacterized protein n=1 Tax=Trichonephila inaurata madagascariensis TaxID=2747483 RepID=A0A8X7C3W8_9ARAC|nr:hypothetical protein TNIN_68991 [Trichonephila inaurata madagascariensis]